MNNEPQMNNNEETVGERKPTERETAPKFFYAFFGYFEIICLSLVAVLVFFSFGARLCRVVGDSMNQTLMDGEQLVTSDLFYTPKVGDVIVFHLCNEYYDEPLVKRVIATEGQEVYINFNTGEVRVDGAAIDEDYVYLEGGEYRLRTDFDPEYVDLKRGILQATVPEGHVFVMGDNRNNSSDSRSYLVGFVDERTILGRALFRIKPFTSLAK